eukprot:g17287.t1
MEPDMLHGTKQWFVYLVIPITTFILSIYFTHEPGYALDERSRHFRCVSRCVDCGCVAIAGSCIYFFAEVAASEFRASERCSPELVAERLRPGRQDRPVRYAYSSGSIALGLMIGPVLGAALSQQGFAAAVRICAALSMLNWTFVFSFMAENVLLRRQPEIDMGFAFDSLPRLAWPLFIGAFLGNAGIAAAESCGALYVMDSYFKGNKAAAVESTRFFAWSMFISGGVVIVITNFVFPSLMRRLKQQWTMLLGICFRIFGYTGLALAPTKWWFLAAQLTVVTGDCLAAPNLSALLTEVVGKSAYGMALGTLSTFQAAARDTVPFSMLYERVSHSAPFLTVALSAVASGALWCRGWLKGILHRK